MSKRDLQKLSRRERQIMDLIYRKKNATAREILNDIENPPSYSAIRASMRILEEKGFLKHTEQDGRYLYEPVVLAETAKRSALHRLLETFFENSASKALSTLLSSDELKIDDKELDELEELITDARKRNAKETEK